MDFLIDRDELLRALVRATGIVEKRSTSPILLAVLVQATADGVRFVATDKAMTFLGDFKAVVRTPGEVAVDAATFFSVARVLPNAPVSVRLVDANRVEVTCGSSLFKLTAFAAADFPVVPPLDQSRSVRVHAKDLRKVIGQTIFSIAPEDNRYGLNGVHIEDVPGDRPMLRMVSTDGNRLSWAQAPYEGELAVNRRTLLPRKALGELSKMIDGVDAEVELAFGERACLARLPGAQLHMRLLETDFPDYRQVLPSGWKRRVIVERDAFGEAMRRASVFAADMSHSVKFSFQEGSIVLTSQKLDSGTSREEFAADLQGEPISIGFNARFVMDVLAACSDGRIVIELGDALAPCIVKPQEDANALFVVMPVRLD